MKGQRSRPRSPDEVVLVVVGADHVHAAGVDQGRDATLHAGAQDVLRSCRGRTELFRCPRGHARENHPSLRLRTIFHLYSLRHLNQTHKNLHPEFIYSAEVALRTSFLRDRRRNVLNFCDVSQLAEFGLNRALHRFQHPFHHRDRRNLTL